MKNIKNKRFALSGVERFTMSVAEGPVLSVAEGPVLSVAEGPVLSVAEGPVLSVAEGPVLSVAEGFVAIISVIIISFVLLLIALSISFSTYMINFNILNTEFKKQSEKLNNACLNVAFLKIISDSYTNEQLEKINIYNEQCEYIIKNNNKIISHACKNETQTFYEIIYEENNNEISINSFKEITNLDSNLENLFKENSNCF